MTIDQTKDPFALGGHEDGDQRVLALFSRWIEEIHAHGVAIDADAVTAVWDRVNEVEREIVSTAGGPVALAIKAFFCVRYAMWEHRKPPPAGINDAVLRYEPDGDPDILDDFRLSILRDAAKVAPALADLVAPLVHEDAALIDADMQIDVSREWLAQFGEEDRAQRRQETEDQLSAALQLIDTTEARTPRGKEIKRRRHAFGLSNLGRQARELKEEVDQLQSRRRDVLMAYDAQLKALWAAKVGAA